MFWFFNLQKVVELVENCLHWPTHPLCLDGERSGLSFLILSAPVPVYTLSDSGFFCWFLWWRAVFVSVGFKDRSLRSPLLSVPLDSFWGPHMKGGSMQILSLWSIIAAVASTHLFPENAAQIQQSSFKLWPPPLRFIVLIFRHANVPVERSEWSDVVFLARAAAVQLAFLLPFKERACWKESGVIIGSCKALIIGEPLITGLCDR